MSTPSRFSANATALEALVLGQRGRPSYKTERQRQNSFTLAVRVQILSSEC